MLREMTAGMTFQLNWLFICVIILFAANIIRGLRKGLAGMIAAVIITVVSVVLSSVIAPLVCAYMNMKGQMAAGVASYIVIYLAAGFILRLIFHSIGGIFELPVLGKINRLAGGIAGAAESFLVVWIFFLVVVLIRKTPAGENLLECIRGNIVLDALYEHNILFNILVNLNK